MGFFEVSRQVRRRLEIAAELPTDHPAVLDEVEDLVESVEVVYERGFVILGWVDVMR